MWRFNADACPAQYNSCRTFAQVAGGPNVSYLLSTIDFGERGPIVTRINDISHLAAAGLADDL